jgi:hypothetical protein
MAWCEDHDVDYVFGLQGNVRLLAEIAAELNQAGAASLADQAWPAQRLYEELYCARGEMENRIKECQLDLFADRTSAATLRANQLRLWLASFA